MTWRIVVISKRSKLYLKMGYLMVRDFENKVNGIFLQDISHLIIATTEASITVSLMNELQKNKIKLIICDEKGNPAAEMLPYYNSYNTNEKIKAQILWKNNTKAAVSYTHLTLPTTLSTCRSGWAARWLSSTRRPPATTSVSYTHLRAHETTE